MSMELQRRIGRIATYVAAVVAWVVTWLTATGKVDTESGQQITTAVNSLAVQIPTTIAGVGAIIMGIVELYRLVTDTLRTKPVGPTITSAAAVAVLCVLGLSGVASGAFYVPTDATTFSTEVNRYAFVRHSSRNDVGYCVTFRKLTTTTPSASIWPIYGIDEGTLRPAWYAPLVPDVKWPAGGAMDSTSGNSAYYQIYNYDSDRAYVQWSVPAGYTFDTIVLRYVCSTATGGVLQVQINGNPKAPGTVIGTLDTSVGQDGTVLAATISLSQTVVGGTGITIAFNRSGGKDVRPCSWIGYLSTGTPAAGEQMLVMEGKCGVPGTAVAVHGAGSSIEFAYSLAPAGMSPHFVGGYTHQGAQGAYSTEVPSSEAFAVDAKAGQGYQAWTPAAGWKSGAVRITRTATVWYDSTHADIATVVMTSTCDTSSLRVDHQFTADATVDFGAENYHAMMAAEPLSTKYELMPSGSTYTAAALTTGDHWLAPTPAYGTLWMSDKQARAFYRVGMRQVGVLDVTSVSSLPYSNANGGTMLRVNSAYFKAYFLHGVNALQNVAAGYKWSGGWQWSVRESAPAYPSAADVRAGTTYGNALAGTMPDVSSILNVVGSPSDGTLTSALDGIRAAVGIIASSPAMGVTYIRQAIGRANQIALTLPVTASYQRFSRSSVTASGQFYLSASCPRPVYLQGTDGSDVEIVAGLPYAVLGVDIGGLQFKGTPGDVLYFRGGTW